MTDNGKLPAEAIFTSENKRVRVYYRTQVNAEDEFNRALILGEYATSDRGDVPLKAICEFTLTTFCNRIELLDEQGGVLETHVFAGMDILKKFIGPYSMDGWPVTCALQIYREVLDQTARVDEVKKTSESGSPSLTPDKSQPAMQPESRRT